MSPWARLIVTRVCTLRLSRRVRHPAAPPGGLFNDAGHRTRRSHSFDVDGLTSPVRLLSLHCQPVGRPVSRGPARLPLLAARITHVGLSGVAHTLRTISATDDVFDIRQAGAERRNDHSCPHLLPTYVRGSLLRLCFEPANEKSDEPYAREVRAGDRVCPSDRQFIEACRK